MTSEARRPTVRLAPLPPSVCGDIKGGKEGGLSGGGGGGSGGRGGSLGAWQASGGGRDGGVPKAAEEMEAAKGDIVSRQGHPPP